MRYRSEAIQVIGMAISRFDRELTVADTDKTLILDYLLKLHWSENFSEVQKESNVLSNDLSVMSVH